MILIAIVASTMELNKVLQYSIIGGIFALFVTPFIVADTLFFPFITGKNFYFRAVVEIILALWLILIALEPSYRPKRSWVLLSVIAFTFAMGIATIVSFDPVKAFWSNFERMEGYITTLHLAAYFLVVGSMITTQKMWSYFWHTSLGASILLSLYGIFQFLGKATIGSIGGDRVDSLFGNPIYFAGYLLFHIFITAFYCVRYWEKGIGVRLLYLATILLNTLVMFLTLTRGAVIGLVGGVLTVGVVHLLFGSKRVRKIGIGIFVVLILIVGIFISVKDSTTVQENPVLARIASISLEENTVQARFMVWGMAWEGFKDRPLFGWGQDGYINVFNKHYDPNMYNQEQWFDRAHNVFLDWLIAGGVVGLLTYLSLFVALLWYLLVRTGKEFSFMERSILVGLVGAYIIQNVFVFDNIASYLFLFSFAAFIHSNAVSYENHSFFDRIKDRFERLHKGKTLPVEAVIPVVAVLLVTTFYFVIIAPLNANKSLLKGLAPGSTIEERLQHFEDVVQSGTFAEVEGTEQLLTMSTRVIAEPGIPNEMKEAFNMLAQQTAERKVEEFPDNVRLKVFYGTYLGGIGFFDEALIYLRDALEISPTKHGIIFQVATLSVNVGDIDGAKELLRGAFESTPSFDEARRLYALLAIIDQDRALAEELLLPEYGTLFVPDDRFALAFESVGDTNSSIEVRKAIIENRPQSINPYINLANTYTVLGNRAEARRVLEQGLAANPGNDRLKEALNNL